MKLIRKVRRAIKGITTVILVLTVLILLIENDNIISFANDKEYHIATADLNVRTGAGTEHNVIFTLQEGIEVEVLSKNNNWYKVRYQGKTGYVYFEYLEFSRTELNENLQSFRKTLPLIFKVFIAGTILIVSLLIIRKVRDTRLLKTVTNTKRGTRSERDLALKLLKYKIPAQMIFHDLYLKKNNGEFTQIDLVVVTEVGIIVFEVKDYSGWIYGKGNQSQWTQVLAYGKQKYRFYNPIMQNNKHIAELKKSLNHSDNMPYYSIVLFYGDCVLKDVSFIPEGTFLVKSKRLIEVIKNIRKNNEPVHYSNMNEMVRILKEAVQNGEKMENQIKHIESINDMMGKDRIFE
ncbi:MAG: hypothetical protein EA412_00250 [Chitinophagaceae bacterium]|nr:MAG: hypothetical protein EA412_00250 [Chitinophagaceae bacterium]